MLKREHRLTKKRDYLAMGRKGRSMFSPFMTFRVRAVRENERKVGFVTPVKSFKKAVDRNRVKRRARHAFRDVLPDIPEGVHIAVLLKPAVLTAPPDALRAEIRRLIARIPQALAGPATFSPREKKRRAKRMTRKSG